MMRLVRPPPRCANVERDRRERLKGFEPSTFCMASSAYDADRRREMPAKRRFRAPGWRITLPRNLRSNHGSLRNEYGTERSWSKCHLGNDVTAFGQEESRREQQPRLLPLVRSGHAWGLPGHARLSPESARAPVGSGGPLRCTASIFLPQSTGSGPKGLSQRLNGRRSGRRGARRAYGCGPSARRTSPRLAGG
jgi:hypothetical protein